MAVVATFRCTASAFVRSMDCPRASLCLTLVTERYLWCCRPMTSHISSCALYCLPLVHKCHSPAFLWGLGCLFPAIYPNGAETTLGWQELILQKVCAARRAKMFPCSPGRNLGGFGWRKIGGKVRFKLWVKLSQQEQAGAGADHGADNNSHMTLLFGFTVGRPCGNWSPGICSVSPAAGVGSEGSCIALQAGQCLHGAAESEVIPCLLICCAASLWSITLRHCPRVFLSLFSRNDAYSLRLPSGHC